MTATPNATRNVTVPTPRARRKRLDAPPLPGRLLTGSVLFVICLVVLLPFLGIVSTSIAPTAQVNDAGGFVMWPKGLDFGAYESIFAGGVVTRALLVSVGITVVGTLISLFVSAMLAYALSRPGSYGHGVVLGLVLVSLLFAPGLIPNYLVVKQFGLLDSYWALILPTALSAFNVIVMRSFFMNIPRELIESARIDGAGDFGVFLRIVLPLSKAVLAVIGLFYAVGYWNAFFNALLYIQSSEKWPMALVLRTYVVNQTTIGGDQVSTEALPPQLPLQMAILVIAIVPILLLYPFLQRHFAKGVMIGAVKG
jgi:multiple sugar transport system permease protein/putative aldouronate transport system permease protein